MRVKGLITVLSKNYFGIIDLDFPLRYNANRIIADYSKYTQQQQQQQ